MTIEITAKKVQDAIDQGCAQLGVSQYDDDLKIEVLDTGGLFKKAKVRLTLDREEAPVEKTEPKKAEKPTEQPKPTVEKAEKQEKPVAAPKAQEKPVVKEERAKQKPQKQEPAVSAEKQKAEKAPAERTEQKKRAPRPEDEAAAKNALEFVKTVIQKMGFDATVTADASGELIDVSAAEGDDSLIIGRHGETLSALSYLAETTARAEKSHINVIVDCNGYRDRRAASLTAMAKRRADECVHKHRKIKLEAMERVDRRTVHNALTDDNRVSTASEGKEPHRYVVIIPKN